MNGYIAFFKGEKFEVYADTSYEAQQKAIAHIGAMRKPRGNKWKYMVRVGLAELNVDPDTGKGEQVIHVAT